VSISGEIESRNFDRSDKRMTGRRTDDRDDNDEDGGSADHGCGSWRGLERCLVCLYFLFGCLLRGCCRDKSLPVKKRTVETRKECVVCRKRSSR
jgi:hypothetical protein